MGIIVSRGFILIEVIISVMLLSLAGTALLKANSNQKKIYSITQDKLSFSKKISIITNRSSADLHNKKINLYDSIKGRYQLKNSELIKILKETEIEYAQKYKSTTKFYLPNSDESLSFLMDTIKLSNKDGTSIYLTVKQ